MYQYDYLIAGSGLAGLYAAYRASQYGTVALVTKCKLTESNTYYAQGGIAAVSDQEDSPEIHLEDTIEAGRGLCVKVAAETLVKEIPLRIEELMSEGMVFDMDGDELSLGLEGGHSKRRVVHAGGDITGRRVIEFMLSKILCEGKIDIYENHHIMQLNLSKGSCTGFITINLDDLKQHSFRGKFTILATGGASAIYGRSTNPHITVGDGISLCYNAGCSVRDMEFVQFHPTSLYHKDVKPYLISEAVRGEGATLLNIKGERFMSKVHRMGELAPRDIVSREIYRETRYTPYVYLYLSHIPKEKIISRFPHIYEKCKQLGIDMCDRIPVAPAAHYTVGGVLTNINGETEVKNLYAIGELASTGVMGANRLASNSLAECLVFAFRAIEHTTSSNTDPFYENTEIEEYLYKQENISVYLEIKEIVSNIMSRHAGIIREESSLREGHDCLKRLEKRVKQLISTENIKEYWLKLSSDLILVGLLIIESALMRKESRGGHYREDYPFEAETIKHTILSKHGNFQTN